MFYLEEVKPRIFCAVFHKAYDLCMTFKRYSESYENDDPRWREYPFTIADFDNHYSKLGQDVSNTYAEDLAGFNLTGKSVQHAITKGIPDINRWDQIFLSIYAMCVAEYPDLEFALIGISREVAENDPVLYKHELAHALYATNPEYKKKMDRVFNKIPDHKKDWILQVLKGWGYDDAVLVDETQAYLGTGIEDLTELEIVDDQLNLKQIQQSYADVFNTFAETEFKKRLVYPYLD